MRKTLIFVALAAAVAAPAFAAPVEVKYKDLDLATAKGQATLQRRIDRAAREICGPAEIRTGSRIQAPGDAGCFAANREAVRDQVTAGIAAARG